LLAQGPNNRILEMGALSPGSLDYFAQRGVLLSVMSIQLQASVGLQAQLDAFTPEQPFDGSLCWDLPGYASAADFMRLGDWLGQNIRPGGAVMLCLATKVPYPENPGRYVIVADDRLEYRAASIQGEGRKRRIHAADLARDWTAFEVEQSFLLRNGMQEYVLRRRTG